MGKRQQALDARLIELVRACRRLDLSTLLTVRRMTLADPQTLRWASRAQLEAAFILLVTEALERLDAEALAAAAARHFDSLVPPGTDDARSEDAGLLLSLSRPLLAGEGEDGREEEKPRVFAGFADLFEHTVAHGLRDALAVLAVRGTRAHIAPPFYLAPTFAECFDHVARRMVLPSLLKSRRIRELGASRNWEEAGGRSLAAMIQAGEGRENVILGLWDSRWTELETPPSPKAKTKPPEETPWERFRDHALANDYQAATPRRAWIFRKALLWDAEALADGWGELAHLYTQEFAPANRHDRGREGSFRDGLLKWIDRLPAHGGEALAAKAFFECPKCDRLFLRKVMQSLKAERDPRLLPLLKDFLDNLPK